MLRPCPWSGVSGSPIIPLVLPCSYHPVEGFRERMDSGGFVTVSAYRLKDLFKTKAIFQLLRRGRCVELRRLVRHDTQNLGPVIVEGKYVFRKAREIRAAQEFTQSRSRARCIEIWRSPFGRYIIQVGGPEINAESGSSRGVGHTGVHLRSREYDNSADWTDNTDLWIALQGNERLGK